jgi:hypothetical protein
MVELHDQKTNPYYKEREKIETKSYIYSYILSYERGWNLCTERTI